MNFYWMIDVRQDFIVSSNIYVDHYGKPRKQNVEFNQTTKKKTKRLHK